uniref:tRNA(Ile)-lysidine/2-thiocytidine synthase N-terminal domain-containing protein n=1 Tax=Strigamia maritima TaxID=126957 RepID=T1JEL5_STRMM
MLMLRSCQFTQQIAKKIENLIILRLNHKMNQTDNNSKHGNRKFYDISSVYDEKSGKNALKTTTDATKLINYVENNVIGRNYTFIGPFGRRKVVYCDFTASGKSLEFIENYVKNEVLPSYGNTHTTTTVTALQSTLFRHEARDIIRNATNASEHDAVVFTGSGCTSAIHKLIHVLKLDKAPVIIKFWALAVWDYATAAPYVSVDMNPVISGRDQGLVYKDAVKKLFRNSIPSNGGGGSVFFVSRDRHRYLKEPEMREEGGTPDIVGTIRAGLVFQLKESISAQEIMKREKDICDSVFSAWLNAPNLILLGSHCAERLAIFSFVIRHPGTELYLHHNFVCALLNDLFGIQARGGCACAGPYALDQLGIDEQLSQRYENALLEDSQLDRTHLRRYKEYSNHEVLRPGFVRLNFPFFMSQSQIQFVINAVKMVAENGWKLLPQYNFNSETGEWRHKTHQVFKERRWLGSISYTTGEMTYSQQNGTNDSDVAEDCLGEAEVVFSSAGKASSRVLLGDQRMIFSDEMSDLRWFLLPSEAHALLNDGVVECRKPLFTPKVYSQNNAKSLQHETTLQQNSSSLQCSICQVPVTPQNSKWCLPSKNLIKPTVKAIEQFNMIQNGDRILVCLSGGKDSLSLLHVLHQYQFTAKSNGILFDLGAVTVDPESEAYDPSSLKSYLKSLQVPYFYEEQGILAQASTIPQLESICSFCSRMKRGRIYACARREGYNVLGFGQHLDDLVETFLMSSFHNGRLRTMKAKYFVKEGDLKVIRPFVYVREKNTRIFAERMKLPVITENCPGCFEAPKERHRTKQLLAQQEILFPRLFASLRSAIQPLMEIDRCGVEGEGLIRFALRHMDLDKQENK